MNNKEKVLLEKYKELNMGYLKAFLCMNLGKTLGIKELLPIAEKSQCHNTGWPIGVVLTKEDHAPYPIENGVEAVISGWTGFDYWFLEKNGNFYFIRKFEEDKEPTKTKTGKNVLWFDIQIWRVGEVLLYCLNLGRELQLDFSKKVDVDITYKGLKDRVLSCNNRNRAWFHDDLYFSRVEEFNFHFSESLDYIKLNFKELVFNIISELTYYFNKFNLERRICDDIVDEFLNSKV